VVGLWDLGRFQNARPTRPCYAGNVRIALALAAVYWALLTGAPGALCGPDADAKRWEAGGGGDGSKAVIAREMPAGSLLASRREAAGPDTPAVCGAVPAGLRAYVPGLGVSEYAFGRDLRPFPARHRSSFSRAPPAGQS